MLGGRGRVAGGRDEWLMGATILALCIAYFEWRSKKKGLTNHRFEGKLLVKDAIFYKTLLLLEWKVLFYNYNSIALPTNPTIKYKSLN